VCRAADAQHVAGNTAGEHVDSLHRICRKGIRHFPVVAAVLNHLVNFRRRHRTEHCGRNETGKERAHLLCLQPIPQFQLACEDDLDQFRFVRLEIEK
jgi:hypothetical protein